MDEFAKTRQMVLQQWATGKDVDFEEAVHYQKRLPASKIFALVLEEALKDKKTLIQPRGGVALVHEQKELLRFLEEEGEADLLPTTIDSYTRHNRFREAQRGIEESQLTGKSLLNGFPAVNHGVALCREVNEYVKAPVEVRHGTPDARLLAEISIAGGFTSFEGGGISYNIPYAKIASLEETIKNWQYVDRLTGFYEEAGVSINREQFGPLTGTLVPPCISHAVAVFESLLAAEQGVRSITVGYGQCGNMVQDIAAIKTLEIVTKEYLEKFGFENINVTTAFHQWMGGFPQDSARSLGLISWGAATAIFSGATKVLAKSPHEAYGVPTKEANVEGLKATKQLITMIADQNISFTTEIQEEMDLIMNETRSIIDESLRLGRNNFADAVIKGFAAGMIDIPFAPSQYSRGKIMPVRDNNGAVRLLDIGNLPFSKEIAQFHKGKVTERAKFEKREAGFPMVVDDIYAIGRGALIGRPASI